VSLCAQTDWPRVGNTVELEPVSVVDEAAPTTSVFVYAADPLLREGVAAWFLADPDMALVDHDRIGDAAAIVAVLDAFDDEAMSGLLRLRRAFRAPILLVVPDIDETLLLRATEIGISGVMRRGDASASGLIGAARSVARGSGALPPDAIGRLFGAMERLHKRVLAPNGLASHGLTERELTVLRLVADGCDTAEIAGELAYSERTIKDILHHVTTRLDLRNRTHAVAYALRTGAL
jgi:DNA-binding NarL/FixJ family response regulator